MSMQRLITGIGIATGLALLGAILLTLLPRDIHDPVSPQTGSAQFRLQDLLSGNANGYARVTGPRPLEFPADHGPHPDYRSEWWYFTGNLQATDGTHHQFGFQLTFFRFALRPGPLERRSAWATRQVYMAHLAVTDIKGERLYKEERFSRAALGLASARAAPFRVRLYEWQAESQGKTLFPLRLQATGENFAIRLRLIAQKPPVLHGEAGYSRKGPQAGNASHYYSYTRLAADGILRIDGREYPVTGSAWLDREWGTSALSGNQVGWDWFALQLDDGSELMYYRFRRRDGGVDPHSSGSYVYANGEKIGLTADEVKVKVLERWRSPNTGVTYPVRWRLHIPSRELDLIVQAKLEHQELDLSVRYWEGAVAVQGRSHGEPVSGHGYVELTGYGT